jgi:hypothetical protein
MIPRARSASFHSVFSFAWDAAIKALIVFNHSFLVGSVRSGGV